MTQVQPNRITPATGISLNNSPRPWKLLEKILFRFFFSFLTLQILTQDFLGHLFGGTNLVWQLGERIFTRPCLWLNDHFFHFHYVPASWTTFSEALHTIRDTVYLLLSIVICIIWSLLDRRRPNYNRLCFWFSKALIMVLSCIVFAYGFVKVLPVQMAFPSLSTLQTPVGSLKPFDLLWTTFGYGSSYQTFTGICEVAGAILILFSRTRVAGLLIIASVMINVIMLNYTFQIGVLMLSFYVLLVTLFLLAPYATSLLRFFYFRQSASLAKSGYVPRKSIKTFRIVAGLLVLASFLANMQYVYSVYERRQSVKRSAQYSQVKHFIVNGVTLQSPENDTTCWRWWSERTADGKRYVTITPGEPKAGRTYTLERDTIKHLLTLQPLDHENATHLYFHYEDLNSTSWLLQGFLGQNRFEAALQKIDPDTVFQLLKARRIIISLGD